MHVLYFLRLISTYYSSGLIMTQKMYDLKIEIHFTKFIATIDHVIILHMVLKNFKNEIVINALLYLYMFIPMQALL